MKNKAATIAILFILLQSLVYGIGDPISKEAYASMSVYSLLTVRYWIAFLFLMLFFGKKVIKEVKNCDWKRLILPSLSISLAYVISNIALDLTTATSTAFLRQTSTVITPLLAFLIYKKHYSLKHIPILAALLAGLYLLCSPDGSFSLGPGEIMALAGAVLIAGSLVFAEDALEQVGPVTVTTLQAGASALVATIMAFTVAGGLTLEGASPVNWAIIIYLALTCTVGGFLLQNYALKSASSTTVAVVQCTYPVMTAICSFFILHEQLTTGGIVGCVIIVISVACENLISAGEEK